MKVACVQMNSKIDITANLGAAEAAIRDAATYGADLVLTPENTATISPKRLAAKAWPLSEADHPAINHFSVLAKELDIWLLIGSVAVRLDDGRFANRSVLFGNDGIIRATYDKMHMFDVKVSEKDTWLESKDYRAGEQAVLADTPWGKIGMTICYDLRFAYLYRDLAHAGAVMLTVPSAFTRPTGQAHWETLLRARAIETGAFVFAPAQTGIHDDGRETWGHSLIIGPWGEVLADGGEDVGVIYAEIDTELAAQARQKIPALAHDKNYDISGS